MQYCTNCLMPNTRPGIKFDQNGICQACINYTQQNNINWSDRWKELENLCDLHRGKNGKNYDCAIAVSGGKDSHYQVYVMKEKLNMNPVLLSVGNIDWTEAGRNNLDNLSETFGCDIIMHNPNRKVAKKMFKKAFVKLGSPSWYLDALIYAFPVKMAIQLGIKLLVYGEDVNYTYGGKYDTETSSALLQSKNDVVKPMWEEWINDGISEQELESAKQPDIEEIKKSGLNPIYLSYYLPWNSNHNYDVAKLWGFKHLGHEYQRESSIDVYDQIDSLSYLLNPYLKYLKYGHAYATDIASRWIRYGLQTRNEMIPLVEKYDNQLDQGVVEKFCDFINISTREFWEIMDKWYNSELFERDSDGIWHPKFKVGKGLV